MAEEIRVLNSVKILHPKAIPAAVELSRQLQQLMLKIKGSFMRSDGKGVDYSALQSSELFKEYLQKTCELTCLEITELSAEEKTAFFLRNKPHPSNPKPLFGKEDPRLQLALPQLDPRIHFALVCGAKSCPAINIYSAKNLEAGLTAATKSFIDQEVSINGNKVTLSKIFDWYKEDFAQDDTGLLRWIFQYASDKVKQDIEGLITESADKISIQWKAYNWMLNKL